MQKHYSETLRPLDCNVFACLRVSRLKRLCLISLPPLGKGFRYCHPLFQPRVGTRVRCEGREKTEEKRKSSFRYSRVRPSKSHVPLVSSPSKAQCTRMKGVYFLWHLDEGELTALGTCTTLPARGISPRQPCQWSSYLLVTSSELSIPGVMLASILIKGAMTT